MEGSAMERAKPYLKVAAVVSSVALVGALVAYRAGAFSKPAPEQQPAAAPPAVPETPPAGSESRELTPAELNAAIMYGSKSAPAFYPVPAGSTTGGPPNTQAAVPSGGPKPPTFMGGSKSFEVFQSPPGVLPAPPQPQPNPPAKPPTFMGGSKSAGVFPTLPGFPGTQPAAPQVPPMLPPPNPPNR
jgi:hypothetical protein